MNENLIHSFSYPLEQLRLKLFSKGAALGGNWVFSLQLSLKILQRLDDPQGTQTAYGDTCSNKFCYILMYPGASSGPSEAKESDFFLNIWTSIL